MTRAGTLRRPGVALTLPSWLRPQTDAAPVSPAIRVATWGLTTVAALGLWLVLFGLLFSSLVESHAQTGLYTRFRIELNAGVAPIGGPVHEGDPVALIDAPRGGLHDVVVVEGTSSRALRSGPGHLPGAPLPGQAGASVLMGRATSFGAPFAGITGLQAGDPITVTTGQGRFTYTVEDIRRPGDRFPPALKAGGSQLTLVTAEGGGWRSGWAPSNAVYVDALLKGTAAPAGPATGIATRADGALHGDTRGMYPMILWLQLALVALIGGVWAAARWGRRQTWIVAAPVLLAGLWGASTNLWLLLPNLI